MRREKQRQEFRLSIYHFIDRFCPSYDFFFQIFEYRYFPKKVNIEVQTVRKG